MRIQMKHKQKLLYQMKWDKFWCLNMKQKIMCQQSKKVGFKTKIFNEKIFSLDTERPLTFTERSLLHFAFATPRISKGKFKQLCDLIKNRNFKRNEVPSNLQDLVDLQKLYSGVEMVF